jgi:hypothetical protein
MLVVVGVADARSRTQGGRTIYQSHLLWATVNACNTAQHPDTVGIRASMPGSGYAQEEMFLRFQLQYFSQKDSHWHNIGTTGDSGWIDVGSARFRARQTGRYFTVQPPANGGSFLLRGAVTFEWRRSGDVVRRARKRTASGHPRTPGADPATYSAANCSIMPQQSPPPPASGGGGRS